MALFRKGILSALADSIAASTEISAAKEKQDLLLTTAENLRAIGEIVISDNFKNGMAVSAELAEVVKTINKML